MPCCVSWLPEMRTIWYLFGTIFLVLAIIGIALPVLPTVPFLLVAAWAFAKSSPKLREKIVNHPIYGPSIRAWQERGVVSPIAKIWALGAMGAGVILSYLMGLQLWIVATQFVVCLAVGLFVASRPAR
jgi:uncharacterized membrane protein YbaN (DUF454 family)